MGAMTLTITSIMLEAPEPEAAEAGYTTAFGLGSRLQVRASDAPTSGFRGFALSVVVSQPSTVDNLTTPALQAGFTVLKPAKMSFWGYGCVLQAPDGTIWKIATSAKKDTGPADRKVDDVVLLLGVGDVKATKQFYIDHGLTMKKGFGSKYVEFAAPDTGIKLALYGRRFAAKDAGVAPEGSGSHRLAIVNDTATFTDPDGFEWERA